MKLINVDELKEKLSQQWFIDILLTKTSSNDMFSALADMIDSQLTAYDVDKVVEQLEGLRELDACDFDNCPVEDIHCCDCVQKRMAERALEIVKGGNIDGR